MSTTVDQRVVEMRFDNKHFESNVSTTMSSLDKLKKSLNMTGATKGLEEVGSATKKVNLSGLGTAVDTVQAKFSSLSVVAATALANITNSAVNAGKRMVSALTIDPVKTGFSEYETKMNAIQTIMSNTASKGTTMQDVTRVIGELNTYADKTIYNFAEMTRNIGTFTAAGVGLEDAAAAIQGIANLAAASGSSSQQASTAMYQLSQALSTGTVRLMDWNSVVNAGMGGQKFQDALKATAREHGVAVDSIIKKNGSFRDSLQDGWLSADILNDTLKKFTVDGAKEYAEAMGFSAEETAKLVEEAQNMEDAATKVKTFTQLWDTLKESAQSGWAQTWEIIVGDFEEAKETLSEISDIIGGMLGKSADKRNNLLTGGLSTGWKQLLSQGIDDAAGFQDMVTNVAKEHGVKLDEMIDDETTFQDTLKEGWLSGEILSESITKFSDKLSGMSEEELKAAGYTQEMVDKMKKLNDKFKKGELSAEEFAEKIARPSGRQNIIDSLWNAFKGLLSVIEPVKKAFTDIFPPITAEQLYSFTIRLKEFTEKLTLSENASKNLRRTFRGLFAILDIIGQAFKAVFEALQPVFKKFIEFNGKVLETTGSLGDWLVGLSESIRQGNAFGKAIDWIINALKKIRDFFKPAIDGIKKFGKSVGEVFVEAYSKASERLSPLAALGQFIKNVFVGLGKIIQKIFPFISAAASAIGRVMGELMSTITSAIQNADYDAIFDTANGGIIAAIGIFIARFIKSGGDLLSNASGFMDNIKGIFDELKNVFNAFTESIKADTLKKIAIAIGILAVSLAIIAAIDSEKLHSSLMVVAALMGELMGAMAIFGKIAEGKNINSLGKISRAMVSLSIALLILSAALKIMSGMSWEEMGVGLISLVVGLGALVAAVNLLPEKKVNKAARAIQKLSKAVLILAVAIKIMSTMSWEEMGIGLITMVAGLGALVGAVNLLPKNTASKAAGMVGLATAMVILAGALKIMATMSWDDIARSLVTLGVSLGILVGAMQLMKKALPGAFAMFIIAPALVVLSGALKIMATMSWEEIAKGLVMLAGSLGIIAGAMLLMKKALPGAFALMIIAPSLVVLSAAMKKMGKMSWSEIARGMVVLAGALTIFGLAARIMKPIIPTMIKLAAAFLILGIACAAIGAGVFAIATGLTAIAGAGAAIAGALVTIISSIVSLIPYIIEQIGVGIIKLCNVIAGGADAIFAAAKTIILAIVDALVACIPAIVEGILVLVESIFQSLAAHIPGIVDGLFDFLIGLINGLATRLPDLIMALTNLLMQLFVGAIEALKSVDPQVLMNGLLAVGVLAALAGALSLVAGLLPTAMVGAIGAGILIGELAIVFAALGELAQIPGIVDMISDGGHLMQAVGTALGQFVGAVAGGLAQGVTATLPQVGSDLSTFMANIQPFLEGASSIDPSAMKGVGVLVGAITAISAANVVEAMASWLTGGSSMVKMGEELAAFGPYMKQYADSVAGIDESAVVSSANAAKALTEMARSVPNEGGVAAWFAGENSLAKFGTELVTLGTSLANYSKAVAGIDNEAIIASAEAAKALTSMADTVPNEGGVAAWFAGENSIAKFGTELVALGNGLKMYSASVTGIDNEAIIASAEAAKALTSMADTVPNEGGVAAWFAGENSIAKFGTELVELGMCLRMYSTSVSGIDTEAIATSVQAAQALTAMADTVPNEGGVVSWFTGDNSIASFGPQLVTLGRGLKGFSDEVAGINPENIMVAATAAQALAIMADTVPNEGGVVSWFAGENSVAAFGGQLKALGAGIRDFSTEVEGIVPENILAATIATRALTNLASTIPNEGGVLAWFAGENSVAAFGSQLKTLGVGIKDFSVAVEGIVPENIVAAATAAKSITDLASTVPNEGGVLAWFAGENSVAAFGGQLKALGTGLKDFSIAVEGIVPENIVSAATAAKSLTDLASTIPNEGGLLAWFAGENSVAAFGGQLKSLGTGLKEFSTEVEGIVPENITAAASAAKALAEMASVIPNEGGIKAWFTGENSMSAFAEQLPTLGKKLTEFSESVAGIVPENITAATTVAKNLAKMASDAPKNPGKLVTFGEKLVLFGDKLKAYVDKTADISATSANASITIMTKITNAAADIDPSQIKSAATAIKDVADSLKDLSKVKGGAADGFAKAVEKLAKTNISTMIKAFKNAGSDIKAAGKDLVSDFVSGVESKNGDMKTAGEKAIKKFIDGIKGQNSKAKSACTDMVSKCATAIRNKYSSFKSAGKYLVQGFAAGITANTYLAEAKARAMANAAERAAKNALDINSPSKVFRALGYSVPEGFAMGIDKMRGMVTSSSVNMARTAIDNVKNSISSIASIVGSDIEAQPTIRPVLDLSDVRAGASSISSMLGLTSSVGVLANVGAVSSMMNARGQNGSNDDVVSAIDKLRKDLGNVGNTTYQVNGITYDDGSNITDAVRTLVRAVKVERRV